MSIQKNKGATARNVHNIPVHLHSEGIHVTRSGHSGQVSGATELPPVTGMGANVVGNPVNVGSGDTTHRKVK